MLNLDPVLIHDLIEESAATLRTHFEAMDELEAWALSSGYGKSNDFEVPDDWPENVPFSFMALVGPRLTRQAPRFAMRGDGNKSLREQALGIQGSLNLLSRQTQMNRKLIQGSADYMYGFCCFFVDAESASAHRLTPEQRRSMKGAARAIPGTSPALATPRGGSVQRPPTPPQADDVVVPHWPSLTHLPRHTYGWDVTAKTWAQVRFYWHDVVEDYEDLLRRAEADPDHWDIEAVKALGQIAENDNPYAAAMARERGGATRRRQVRYRMVYVPEGRIMEDSDPDQVDDGNEPPPKVERQPKPNEHGVWLTIGVPGSDVARYQHLRQSGVFGEDRAGIGRGPKEGMELAKPFYRVGGTDSPYKIFGHSIPASSTIPFSPLTANRDQIRLWNDLAASAARRMRRYSRQVLYDLKDESIREAINEASDDDFVGVPGFETGRAMVVERGGLSQLDMAHLAHQQGTVYRGLGMSQTLQGNATNNTATAESAAVQTGMLRIEDVVAGWEEGLAAIGQDMARHMAYSDTFWVVLDDEAKAEMMMQDIAPFIESGAIDSKQAERLVRMWTTREVHVWQGGDFDQDHGLDFGLLRCEVEPYSMERRNLLEQQQALLGLIPVLAQIGQLAITQPHMEWRERLRELGRVFQMPDLEKMLRMDIAQQMSQIMIAQGLTPQATDGSLHGGAIRIGGSSGGQGQRPTAGRGAGQPGPSRAVSQPAGAAGGPSTASRPTTLSV